MNGRLFAQTFSLPKPAGSPRRSGKVSPTHGQSQPPENSALCPVAGIESELKLLMPLSPHQVRASQSLPLQAEIGLAYFGPRETRRIISLTMRTLPYLIVDDSVFSLTELGNGQVSITNSKAGYHFELFVFRKAASSKTILRRSLLIPNKLAPLLQREPDPSRRARLVMKYAGPIRINGKQFSVSDFISARLREVRCGSSTRRFLDLKGRRHGSHHLHRAEVSIPLSAVAFRKLLKRSDGGVVKKTRSIQCGQLAGARGSTVAAEVDILFACGKNARLGQTLNARSLASQYGLSDFALVEIELPKGISRQLLLHALMTGAHSLSFLRGPAISLSFRSKRGWELLGMKRLAARGLEPSTQELLRTLLAPYSAKQRPRKKPATAK